MKCWIIAHSLEKVLLNLLKMKIITPGSQTTNIPETIKLCNNTHQCSFQSLFLK